MRLFRFEQEEFASIAITETTQARADAKRVQLDESRARALAQHQSELTVVLNEDRRVVYASAALEPITGEQAFDVLGSPFEFILDQPSRIEFRRAVDRILREQPGDRQHPSLLLRTRAALAGTGRSISCVIANRLDDPRVRGLVLTARDLGPAERAQARRLRFRERLLELAIQPKSDFTHALSAILRTCDRSARRRRGQFLAPVARRRIAALRIPVRPRQRSLHARLGGTRTHARRAFPLTSRS